MTYFHGTGNDTDIEAPPKGMTGKVVRGHYTDENGLTMLVLSSANNPSMGVNTVGDTEDIYIGVMFGKTYYVTAKSLETAGFKLSKYFDEEGKLHDAR